jgi:hypothetical protein
VRVKSRIGQTLLFFVLFILIPGPVLRAQGINDFTAYVGEKNWTSTGPATVVLRFRVENGNPDAVRITLGNMPSGEGGFEFRCMAETIGDPFRVAIVYRTNGGQEREFVFAITCLRRDHSETTIREIFTPEPPSPPNPPKGG